MSLGETTSFRLMIGAWALVVGFLVVAVVATWPSWWRWIAPEAAPSREVSTMLLLASAAVALSRARAGDTARWLCLGAGFVVLAADERGAIHERLRDRVLAPNDVDLPFVPWAQPGDIVLVVGAMIGLASLPWLVVAIRGPRAKLWFAFAIVLAVTAVGLDTLPIETYSIDAERRFQTGEEIIELAAAASFLSALLSVRTEDVPDVGEPRGRPLAEALN